MKSPLLILKHTAADHTARNHLPYMAKVFAIFVALDITTWIGGHIDGQEFGRAICSVRSAGTIGQILVPGYLLEYATQMCDRNFGEPATSIVVLTLKLTISVISVPIGILSLLLAPSIYYKMRTIAFEKLRTNQYATYLAMYRGPTLLILASTAAFGLFSLLHIPPNTFPTDIIRKILIEDLFCLGVMACLFWIVMIFADFVLWPLQHKLTKREKLGSE